MRKAIVTDPSPCIANTVVGINSDNFRPITIRGGKDNPPIFEFWYTADEAYMLAQELMKRVDRVGARLPRIRKEDIVDGAVFRTVEGEWRKVVEVHSDRFIVVDRCGRTQHELTSSATLAAFADRVGYSK